MTRLQTPEISSCRCIFQDLFLIFRAEPLLERTFGHDCRYHPCRIKATMSAQQRGRRSTVFGDPLPFIRGRRVSTLPSSSYTIW